MEESASDDPLNFHTSNNNISSNWRFSGANLTNPSASLVPTNSSITNPSMGSSVSMANSFCPALWDHQSLQNLGFSEHNIQSNTSRSSGVVLRNLGHRSSRSGIEKPLDIGWNLPNSMSKGGVFIHTDA